MSVEERTSSENLACFNKKEMKLLRKMLEDKRSNGHGDTALIRAVLDEDKESVKLLIKIGVNLNQKDYNRDTALSLSKQYLTPSFKKIENMLTEAGAKDEYDYDHCYDCECDCHDDENYTDDMPKCEDCGCQ